VSSGIDVLHDHDPDIPVILMTAYADLDMAIAAIKEGAYLHAPAIKSLIKIRFDEHLRSISILLMSLFFLTYIEK
jgi:ActR/RegA family two-component response regulator